MAVGKPTIRMENIISRYHRMAQLIRRMTKPKKYRLQFDLSEEDYEAFKELQKQSRTSTNAALVARSLAVYKWILDKKKSGATLQVVEDGIQTQVELLPV